METTNASLKYSPEYRTPKIQLKRERLFWLQTIILAGLVMISGLTFIFHNELVISKSIKLVFQVKRQEYKRSVIVSGIHLGMWTWSE